MFGDFLLQSQSGIQQGDPLGPLLFCLATRDLSASMQSPLNTWYLDDGTVGGPVELVQRDLLAVLAKGREIGLELNLGKCEAFVCGGDADSQAAVMAEVQAFAPGIQFPGAAQLSLLGSPLTAAAIATVMEEKIATARLLTDRLVDLSAHDSLFLLKNCLGTPKVLYVLRSSPAYSRPDKLDEFDNVIRESVTRITNTAMTNDVWRQVTLPVARGGLGIRRTAELAFPAYLASVHAVQCLISLIAPDADIDDTVLPLRTQWQQLTGQSSPPARPTVQKEWDAPLVLTAFSDLFDVVSERDRVRLLAEATKESGAWLNALPLPALGTWMDDDSLRIAVGLRVGAIVCEPHKCKCSAQVDSTGHHGLSCSKGTGRYSRHSALNDVIKRALVTASVPAILEPPGLERENNKRPDGMTLAPWKNGKALVWDVTCVDTLAKSYIVGCLDSPGYAANEAEKKKIAKYQDLEGRFNFTPLAFETLGPWGLKTKETIAEIGRRIADRTGEPRATEFLRQRISIEIQRGNAACVLNTASRDRGLDEVYNILHVKQ